MNQICASIVTYHPNWELLRDLLQKIKNQVTAIIIFDNTANTNLQQKLKQELNWPHLHCTVPDENMGIAGAHNHTIELAKQRGFDYVILFDQDSLPADNMIPVLMKTYEKLLASGHPVAAVGPRYVDIRTGISPPFYKLIKGRNHTFHCSAESDYFWVDCLINSGQLVKIDSYEKVGKLDEELFLDTVDLEWGMRALVKGLRCYGVCPAILYHRVGDTVKRRLGRNFHIHSPLRNYYMFRNRIAMYKRRDVPLSWKLNDIWRFPIKIAVYALFFSPRILYMRMIFLGIWDGICGRMGRYTGKLCQN